MSDAQALVPVPVEIADRPPARGRALPSWKHNARLIHGPEPGSSGNWSLRLRSEKLLSPIRHDRSGVQARST